MQGLFQGCPIPGAEDPRSIRVEEDEIRGAAHPIDQDLGAARLVPPRPNRREGDAPRLLDVVRRTQKADGVLLGIPA